jgi:hypothetical protein
MPEDDRDSAAPTAATVAEVCKIQESRLRAVGVAAIAGLLLHLGLHLRVVEAETVGCHCAGCHEGWMDWGGCALCARIWTALRK